MLLGGASSASRPGMNNGDHENKSNNNDNNNNTRSTDKPCPASKDISGPQLCRSDDILLQILAWLPLPSATRTGVVSRAFSRAALTCIRTATWQRHSTTSCRGGRCGQHEKWNGEALVENTTTAQHIVCMMLGIRQLSSGKQTRDCFARVAVGVPCLDLRGVGSKADGAALRGILSRAFAAVATSMPAAATAVAPRPETNARAPQTKVGAVDVKLEAGQGGRKDVTASPVQNVPRRKGELGEVASGEGSDAWRVGGRGAGSAGEAEVGTRAEHPPVLRGLAVCSSTLEDEAVQRALDSHGRGLKVLSLAGCCGLVDPGTIDAIRRQCTNLVKLDLSTTLTRTSQTPPSLYAVTRKEQDAMCDKTLASLLSNIGSGLISLRLFDCHSVAHDGLLAIAGSCPVLRDLDIGTGPRSELHDRVFCQPITERSLEALYESPCAKTLEILGLRTRNHVLILDGLCVLGDRIPGLRRLDVGGIIHVNDSVLESIASKLSLTHIGLSGCHKVTGRGVTLLAQGSPDLEWVSLHGTGVSDGGVRALCESCPGLRWINLSLTGVTGRALRSLGETDSLRWVNLRCCPNIQGAGTSQNVVDLRSRLAARGPRYNRGAAFVMERPESQFHAISPDRATSPALSNIDRGDRGDADREDLSGSHRAHLQKRLNSTRYLSPQEAFRNSPGGDISGSDIRPPDTLTPRTDTGIAVDSSTLGSDVARPNTPKSDTTVTAAVEPRDHLAPASTAFSSIGKASGRQGAQQEQPGGGYCTTPSPPPAKKVPLLPSGVGDFSLGQRRWKQGTRSPDPAIGDAPSRAGMESSGRCATTTKENGILPFAWDAVPRESGVGELGAWRGFRGLPGDVAREVILELHPFASVEFVPKRGASTVRSRRNYHGYQVHTSKFGHAWVQLSIDEQGCVC